MKWDEIKIHWKEFSSALLARWNRLSEDDLRDAVGKRELLAGKIVERYGVSWAEAERQIDEWLAGR